MGNGHLSMYRSNKQPLLLVGSSLKRRDVGGGWWWYAMVVVMMKIFNWETDTIWYCPLYLFEKGWNEWWKSRWESQTASTCQSFSPVCIPYTHCSNLGPKKIAKNPFSTKWYFQYLNPEKSRFGENWEKTCERDGWTILFLFGQQLLCFASSSFSSAFQRATLWTIFMRG